MEEDDKDLRPRRCARFQHEVEPEEDDKDHKEVKDDKGARPRRCSRFQRSESETRQQESFEEKRWEIKRHILLKNLSPHTC